VLAVIVGIFLLAVLAFLTGRGLWHELQALTARFER
jgi:hypothetical protein